MSKKPKARRPRSESLKTVDGEAAAREKVVEETATGRLLVLAEKAEAGEMPDRVPLLPLRSDVVFPQTVVPLVVNRPAGIKLIDEIMADGKTLGMVAQRHPETDDPSIGDLYPTLCIGNVLKMLKFPDGSTRVVCQGVTRARLIEIVQTEPYLVGRVEPLEDVIEEGVELDALVHHVNGLFQRMIDQSQQVPEELQVAAMNTREPGRLADLLGSSLPFTIEEKQQLLAETNVRTRLERLGAFLNRQLTVLELSTKIQAQVGSEITKAQRDHFLRQQIKAIQDELGESESDNPELDELWDKLEKAKPPAEVLAEAEREMDRLAGMHPSSAEYSIVRTYLDWLAVLPWDKASRDRLDLRRARKVPGRGPLRPGEDQGADPRIPGRPEAQEGHEGADPLLRRPAGDGEDEPRQEHRQGPRPPVRPDQPRRRPRRGRDPRPPPDLRRRDARPGDPGDPQVGDEQPGLHARRGRQARRRLPGRPVGRAPRSPRPGAERDVPRPLPRRRFRPLEGDVHRHGEHARDDPGRPCSTGWK